ncbi:MAG: hypothetical protein MK222_03920, partial [Candidatus Poseidoniia archaeon]|nr:hypothetical protein [Candidatus Poseidoniia archaeon]
MATDWFEAIDNYCERTDASLWAEPLNAFSNLAFIAAFVAGAGVGAPFHSKVKERYLHLNRAAGTVSSGL